MSFHESATRIELEDGHILKAVLKNADDEEQESELDLNFYIGNNNGHFCWGGENFEASTSEISFELEGDDNVPILRAKLAPMEGDEVDADINLAERIGNDNGKLVFWKEGDGDEE